MHLRQSRGIADIQRKWCISIWLALFVATVATDGAVFVATLPVSQFFYFFSLAAPLAHAGHFLAALGPGRCSVCSQQ